MKKLMLVSALVVSGLVSGVVAAAEVGKVVSSTPVLKRVTEPKTTCANDSAGRQSCTTANVTEDRLIGYKVVYEYAGKQGTVQLPFPPGPTIELEIQPVGAQSSSQVSPQPLYSPGEVISSSPQVVYSPPQVVYQQPVYVEPAYYPVRTYYPSSYYYDPVWPALAVGVGLGYVFRGGCCWSRGGGWHGHGRR